MLIVTILNAILTVVSTISKIISKTLWYKNIFKYVGVVATRKFKPAKQYHKYAIIIAARNERTVIGNLIDSVNRQNYPKDMLDIFGLYVKINPLTADELNLVKEWMNARNEKDFEKADILRKEITENGIKL